MNQTLTIGSLAFSAAALLGVIAPPLGTPRAGELSRASPPFLLSASRS